MQFGIIITLCLLYLVVLFGIAYYAEYKSKVGKSLVDNPYVYALSLTTYCTAWTFYGSVGKAATTGIGFLPTYLGPVILSGLWIYLFKIIIRICKNQRITSIADFIASRYGKNNKLGALVAIVSLCAIIPYISLQLKAIANSFDILVNGSQIACQDCYEGETALITAVIMCFFIIIFGTRKIDASERQEGMVYAIAFEAVFKLIAFLIVGAYVTYGIFDGFIDVFNQAEHRGILQQVISVEQASEGGYWDWFMLINLSFLVFMLLPRQFYLIAVQNTNEEHSHTASWLFPLYLLTINIFIIPLALGGLIFFDNSNIDADTFVLYFPILNGQDLIAILVFLGGFAAATGMIIVSAYAIATMLSNNIILPTLLEQIKGIKDSNIPKIILATRRFSIIMVMVLAYLYLKLVGKNYPLVEIGLISFVGIAQLAPSFFGALFWKQGNRKGVIWGLSCGFIIWIFTLVFPTLIKAEIINAPQILTEGLFSYHILVPYQLFGFSGMGNIVHGMFWSLFSNFGLYFFISLSTKPSLLELEQAALFSVSTTSLIPLNRRIIYPVNSVCFYKVEDLLVRFMGKEETQKTIKKYFEEYSVSYASEDKVNASFIDFTERLLTGVVGSTAAKILISKIVKQKTLNEGEVLSVISETQNMLSYSKELEDKSKAVEIASTQLQHANHRLKELDRLKDEFISTVTHELRTPLTSIRALSELLSNDKYNLKDRQKEFHQLISKESERLSRLINEILDFEKLSQDSNTLKLAHFEIYPLLNEAIESLNPIAEKKHIMLWNKIANSPPIYLYADRDKIKQVIINLMANAIKFSDLNKPNSYVFLDKEITKNYLKIIVKDNGIGIAKKNLNYIFEEFKQVTIQQDKPKGTGLGLAISKKIINKHNGKIGVSSRWGKGTEFYFILPLNEELKNGK